MPTFIYSICIAAAVSICPATMGVDDCFDAAKRVPPTVDSYIHIQDAKGLRRMLADRPIGEFLRGAANESPLFRAWQELSKASEAPPEELFDALLGTQLTLAFRRDSMDRLEWGVLTTVSDDVWAEFNRRVRPQIRPSRRGVSIRLLPEQSLLFARSGTSVLIGPDPGHGPSLFEDMFPFFTANEPAGPSLASTHELAEARALGDGRIGVFMRHRATIRGWSAAVIQVDGDECVMKHVSEIEDQSWTDLERWYALDEGLMNRLADKHLIVAAVPLRSSFGPFGAFVRAQLPADAMNESVRSNLRKHFIVIVGSGRSGSNLGVLFPLKSAEGITPDFDRAVFASIAQLREALDLAQPGSDSPIRTELDADIVRHAHIGDIIHRMYPSFDPEREATLHWTCRDSESGSWAILATSDLMARQLVAATNSEETSLPPQPVHGIRVSTQAHSAAPLLRTFADRLAAAEKTDAQDFVGLLRSLADAAAVFRRVDIEAESMAGRLRTNWRAHFAETMGRPK